MQADWRSSLDEPTRARADSLLRLMTDLGAPDAEAWVKSEIQENLAQVATFLVLHTLWVGLIDGQSRDTSWITGWAARAEIRPREPFSDAGQAIGRMLEAGVALEDLATFARGVAYEAVFGTLQVIDEGHDPDLQDPEHVAPGWVLVETDNDGESTDRPIGLHESFLSLDPSGREGRPA
jgi:hypothetical protein